MNDRKLSRACPLRTLILLVVSLTVGAAAITHQSFWMDEGNAIFKAMMPSLPDMWNFSKHMRGSEIQMPLFMLSLWGWVKIGWESEYALRAINLPFLAIMVLAFRRYRFWPLVCLTSPFVLYYVGELRPYMFQMAGAAVGFSALCQIVRQDPKSAETGGINGLLFSSIFMAATSLTAAVCSIGLCLGLVIARPHLLKNMGFWKRVAIWSPLALLVATYYTYTLMEGFRGAVDRGGGLLSMGFGGYEMIGLMGLGPGRDEIRGSDLIGLLTGYPWLPLFAAVIAVVWLIGVGEFAAPYSPRAKVALASSVILPVTVFAAVSVIANFSILGRHMSPLIPALLVPLACCCDVAVRKFRSRPFVAVAVSAVIACGIASSAMLRFSERHERDDYRSATHLALKALRDGQTVLWQGDMNAPRYYAYREGGMPLVNYLQRLESEMPSSRMFADIIFINRPDLRFEGADHLPILKRDGFELKERFPGFEIWENGYSKIQ
ncbi:MAG: hypothetical protein ABJQ29_12675 [Luteolibacter sp.]